MRFAFLSSIKNIPSVLSFLVFLFLSLLLLLRRRSKKAHRAERETAGETAGRCLTVLRRIFPEVTVPAPLHAAASRWGSDKWSRGSYRYIRGWTGSAHCDSVACLCGHYPLCSSVCVCGPGAATATRLDTVGVNLCGRVCESGPGAAAGMRVDRSGTELLLFTQSRV